ncbi:MAG: rane protein [Bryobacterales bacterium]|nr:rane protein [Bryobacterales bacterium]
MSRTNAPAGTWRLLRAAASDWSRHNAPRLGAALAFYTVLSLAPLLLIVFAICSMAFGEDAVRGQIFWQIRGVAGDQAAALVQSLLKQSYHPGKGFVAGAVGVPVLLFGASGVLVELRDTLNYIWDTETPARGFGGAIRYRLITLAMVPGIGLLMIAGITASLIIEAAGAYLSRFLSLPIWLVHTANQLLTFLTLSAIFALVYRIFPAKRVPWKAAVIGALVTAGLFCIGNLLVLAYVTRTGTGSAYGAAGSLVVFLVWVYYSSQIFLFSAEFTHVYASLRPGVVTQVH